MKDNVNSYVAREKINNKIQNGDYNNKLKYYPNGDKNTTYHEETCRLENLFRNDLKEAFGFGDYDSPDFSKVFSAAWEQGHSSGYYEVLNYFCDFFDIYYLGVLAGRTGRA